MPVYDLPIPVEFPFPAYECQLEFMTTVIRALQNSENALLESPTGTGKTLSLLCASLAFLHYYRNRKAGNDYDGDPSAFPFSEESAAKPRIIYASRTHSQLSQVIHELRRTAYRDTKICVMGSREQMCINEKVNKLSSNAARTHLCRQLVSQKSCFYHTNMNSVQGRYNYAGNELKDIEELVQYGQEVQACPYYMARDSQASAEIIFIPYNYIVDPASRKSQNIQLENSIIIFDEAHNLESSCGEACSFELTPTDIAMCFDEVQRCAALQDDIDYRDRVVVNELNILKILLHSFQDKLNELPLCDTKDLTLSGEFIFTFFESVGITFKNVESLMKLCDNVVSILSQEAGRAGRSFKPSLAVWQEALKVVFHPSNRNDKQSFARNYKLYVHMESQQSKQQTQKSLWSSAPKSIGGRILSFWCFSSGVTMRQLIQGKCRSIILASGTLSPLDSFAAELQIPFPHRLENPHVIDKSQILVNVVCRGPTGVILNSSYQNRNSSSYQTDLGQSIIEFCRIVPDGLLVFFPSYGYMAMCVEQWKRLGLWSKISALKVPYVEPKDKQTFSSTISTFYDTVGLGSSSSNASNGGAVFFAVCRGKASEGIDFSDTRGRAVILTGIPFASVADPRVKLKKQFLDENYREWQKNSAKNAKTGISLIDGQNWYKQQAARAVNQALGRVIRHRHDWGAVLLCDERFAQPANINGLPLWLRGYVQVEQSFASVQQGLRRFVEDRTRMAKELEALKAAAAPTLIPLASGPPMRTTTNTGLLTTTKRALQLKQETGNSLSAAASKIFPQIQIQPQLTHPQQQRQYVAPVKTMGGGVSLLGTVNSIISANQIHTSATELQRRPLLSVDGQQFSRFTQQPFQKTINTAENRQICDRSSSPVATQVSKPIDTTETPSSATTSANVNEFLQTLRTVLSKPDYKQFQLLLKSFKKKEIKMDRLTEEIIRLFSACNRLDLCQGLLPFLPAKHHESFADRVKRESSNAANAIESADAIMCNIDEKTVDEASDSCTKQQQQQSKSHCPMCKRKPIKPFQSRCKHVGCYDCWVIWLEASKACPICEKPTRLRQLSKLYFI